MGEDAALQAKLDDAAAAADAMGVVIIDRLWSHPFELLREGEPDEETYEQVRDGFIALLRAVPAGVTEIYLHPMIDDDELRAAVDFSAAEAWVRAASAHRPRRAAGHRGRGSRAHRLA